MFLSYCFYFYGIALLDKCSVQDSQIFFLFGGFAGFIKGCPCVGLSGCGSSFQFF
jgi:hypothetical protein